MQRSCFALHHLSAISFISAEILTCFGGGAVPRPLAHHLNSRVICNAGAQPPANPGFFDPIGALHKVSPFPLPYRTKQTRVSSSVLLSANNHDGCPWRFDAGFSWLRHLRRGCCVTEDGESNRNDAILTRLTRILVRANRGGVTLLPVSVFCCRSLGFPTRTRIHLRHWMLLLV